MTEFEEYKQELTADIEQTVTRANCQPVIFAGTGLSIRYFDAPSWDGLLKTLVQDCDGLEQDYGFYRQTRGPTEPGIWMIPYLSLLGSQCLIFRLARAVTRHPDSHITV